MGCSVTLFDMFFDEPATMRGILFAALVTSKFRFVKDLKKKRINLPISYVSFKNTLQESILPNFAYMHFPTLAVKLERLLHEKKIYYEMGMAEN